MSVINTSPQNRIQRRQERTRALLREAVRSLLTVHGYEEITIKAITDYADVGHGTFYLYYQNKDELIWETSVEVIEEYVEEMNRRISAYPFLVREYLGFLDSFTRIDQTRELFLSLYGARGSAYLSQRYQLHLAEIYERNLRAQIYSAGDVHVATEFMAQFMAGATMRLTLWWLEEALPYTPADMANMLFELVYRRPPPPIPPHYP